MAAISWGLLGPETLASEHRTRALGLGATVRSFNDLAVPGLGGGWFGKQLLLGALGVAIAERVRNSGKRAQNIEVTNAVEALACWLALDFSGWKRDPRLRGALKLSGKKDLSFATVSKRSFYVTQPMRQATVQPLRALGVIESSGERFNAFRCTRHGEAFIEASARMTYGKSIRVIASWNLQVRRKMRSPRSNGTGNATKSSGTEQKPSLATGGSVL